MGLLSVQNKFGYWMKTFCSDDDLTSGAALHHPIQVQLDKK